MEEDHTSLFDGMDFVLSVAPDQDLAVKEEHPVDSTGALDEDLFTGLSIPSDQDAAVLDSPSRNGDAKISLSNTPCMERKSFDSIMAAYDSAGITPSVVASKVSVSSSISSKAGVGRKKKKSLRIGYGRDNDDGEDREAISSDQGEIRRSVHASEVVTTSLPDGDGVSSISSLEFSQRELDVEIIENAKLDKEKSGEGQLEIEEMEIATEVLTIKERALESEVGEEEQEEHTTVTTTTMATATTIRDTEDMRVEVEVTKVAGEVLVEEPEVVEDGVTNGLKTSTVTMAKLTEIKQDIARRLRDLEAKAAQASVSRKMASQVRRRAAEELSAATAKRKELELELESACEREDFDLADKLSQEVADAEKALEVADLAYKEADGKYDTAAMEMENIVALKVGIEEEGAAKLENLQEDAQVAAERVKMEAGEIASMEMENLASKGEDLDKKNTQCLQELRAFEEFKAELDRTIAEAVEPDVREKADHLAEREVLVQELEELLKKMKDKEAQIARRDRLLEEIDAKIAGVTATFEDKQSSIEADLKRVTSSLEDLRLESASLQSLRMEVQESLTLAEAEAESLKSTADAAAVEALLLREELERWRKAAEFSKEIKDKKLHLLQKEEEFLAESQALRQQATEARGSLQELSLTKMKLQEDIRAAKQKLAQHEKRGPALEAEKRLAAATRKFKEAARLSAEAKAFRAEQEAVMEEVQKCSSELQQVEECIEAKIASLADIEGLIAVKERKAAQACCERLRLVAVAARNERSVAIELDDLDEAESLQAEAVAADAEADELQRIHQFEFGNVSSEENEDKDADAVES